MSETQVINAIRETHNELTILEFNDRRAALIGKFGPLRFDMCESDSLNRLPHCHI